MVRKVKVSGEYIQLNQLLKLENIAMSGGHAKEMIEQGLVKVNGATATEIRKKIRSNDKVEVGKITLLVTAEETTR